MVQLEPVKVVILQSSSNDWRTYVSTAWAFMQGLIGWSQCMQEIVGRITVNFGEFKEFIGLQLLRYVRSLEGEYLSTCLVCICFI